MRSDYRIFGKVQESGTKKSISGLIVEVFDKDTRWDDLLGTDVTDTNGNFEIKFDTSDFKERHLDERPDIYIRVKTPNGEIIHSTENEIRYKADKEEEFTISLDEEIIRKRSHTLITNLDLGEAEKADLGESIKVAAVRNGQVLGSKVIRLGEIENIRSIPVEIEYRSTERERPLGVNFVVGPDVPDEKYLAAQTYTRWISPKAGWEDFKYRIPDIVIPDSIVRWWCRSYTIRGKIVCTDGNPVPGAKVEAKDVDFFWWWWRKDTVGSAITDENGDFEINFRWCCRFPWYLLKLRDWTINPDILEKIHRLFEKIPVRIPPLPDPVPDLRIFEDLVNIHNSMSFREDLKGATGNPGIKSISAQSNNLEAIRKDVLKIIPDSSELYQLHIWPWWSWRDCRPDIIFRVTQDCEQPDTVIYEENYLNTRWNIPTLLDGVTLIANEKACCSVEIDPPDGDCFRFSEVGCTSLMNIGGNDPMVPVINDLKGFAYPNNLDRPFGGTLSIKGVFGDLADADYYRIQYSEDGLTYNEMPPDMVNNYARKFWGPPISGGVPQWNTVLFKNQEIDGHWVFETREKFEQDNDPASWGITRIWTSNKYLILSWNTEHPLITDGLKHLQLVAYDTGPGGTLANERIMPLCGTEASGSPVPETMLIRIDNRILGMHPPSVPNHPWGPGYIHKGTVEPDCDIIQVVKNAGTTGEQEVKPCSILRLKAGDDLTICFNASDTDGHLQAYFLSLHWSENSYKPLINGISGTSLGPIACATSGCSAVTPCMKGHEAGPRYQDAVAQGADRPIWYGGNYRIQLKGSDFPTCCAYLLRLRTWKRTFRGCDDPYHFHWNIAEYSFTVIREDLIGNPLYKECKEICEDEKS